MTETAAFDAVATAKTLLRKSLTGALSTLMPGSGDPYGSLVNVATEAGGAPILLISRLAVHTRNILADSRVSLLLDEREGGEAMALTRIMIGGRAQPIEQPADARRRYLARHPDARTFVDFPDFGFYRIVPTTVHLVAGFGRITDIAGAALLTDLAGADDVLAGEEGAVEHMNDDHADAILLYATKLLGAPAGEWRMTGADPEGADLMLGRSTLRLPFPARVNNMKTLQKTLVALVGEARARP